MTDSSGCASIRSVRWLPCLLVVALTAFAVQTTGALVCSADSTCSQSCPDDNSNGQCPPGCADCACCGHLPSIPSPHADGPALYAAVEPATPIVDERAPPSAEPHDILHVPKLALT